ncbi:hypothetical protein FQR65_LT17013 [Abscondita terminalis]|nr:hypothetical protein FQR65_LT17013 [Abscondita terminalis]
MNEVIYGEYENDEDYLIKFADEYKQMVEIILTSAYPELELIFKEHGLSVGIEEEYFMDTFNSIFETVIFTVGKVVGIANKLISKSSSLIKYVLKIVGADLAIIGIAINTEFKSIEKEIKILSE